MFAIISLVSFLKLYFASKIIKKDEELVMLIDLVKLIVEVEGRGEAKEWSKKLNDWLYKHREDKSITSVDSWGITMLECSTARRYIVNARSIKNKEKIIMKIDELEKEYYESRIESLKIKNSKYDNEFKVIFGFKDWEKTYIDIESDFANCETFDEVMDTIFKWTYGITYFSKYSSIRSKLTTIRKVIVNSKDIKEEYKELILKHLRLPKFISDNLKSRITKEVITRAKNKDIEKIKVQDVKNTINKTKTEVEKYLNRSNDFRLGRKSRKIKDDTEIGLKEGITNLMIFLTLTTGRRPIELLKMSDFKVKSENLIAIKYLAKKRNAEVELVIPTLFAKADLVVRAIEFLRKNFNTATMRSRESNITRKLYAYVENEWNKVAPEWLQNANDKFKKCRAIYILSLEALINQSIEDIKMSQSGFISKFLGHNEDDITTQSSYYKASILIGNFNKKKYFETIKDVIEFLRNEDNRES